MNSTETHTPAPWVFGNVDNMGEGFLIWSATTAQAVQS
jgi:hypothetical protein